MGEILSHAEVEAILSAVQPSRPVPRDSSGGQIAEQPAWELHDFQHPQALRGAALKMVHALHQGICQRWQSRLGEVLQSVVSVKPVGACQSSAAEFLASDKSPQVICLLRQASTTAESLLVWNAGLARALLARMLGGGDGGESPVTSMTNIELRLLNRLNEAVLGELSSLLKETWHVSQVLQGDVTTAEISSQFPSIWFSFEAETAGGRGLIHLGIPAVSFNVAGAGASSAAFATELGVAGGLNPGVQQVCVQVTATLGLLKIRAADLMVLQVGDLVVTDMSPGETVALKLDGKTLCQATIGTHLGRKALRLTGSLQHGDV
jgi:flagellar motor switch protein FliM